MKYNVTLPPQVKFEELAWREQEQQAIIVDLETSKKISKVESSFIKKCRSTLPEAVYYHTRNGEYRVYGLANYDNCSGIMTFYCKAWHARPKEMSKSIPMGVGAKSLAYMPNEKSVLLINDSYLYKIDRYEAKVKMQVPLGARAIFAGQNIYAAEGADIKEYSPKGHYIKKISPSLPWAKEINSGAVNYVAKTFFVCNDKGQLAILNIDNGACLAEGVFKDTAAAGLIIVGFNGEYLMIASIAAKKIYWLDMNFKEIASVNYSEILPYTPLLCFDGRDILAINKTDGTLYTFNIQDNWDYRGIVYTATKMPEKRLSPKILDIDNILILYCEYPWNKAMVKSVIGYLDANNKATDIMFDGLLIMAQTHNGKSLMGEKPAAGLDEWNWYLGALMNTGGTYQLVELAAREVQVEAERPDYKPKVFIGIPYPMDSLERHRWFIDECISRASGYSNVLLAGFYYTEEFKPDSLCKKVKEYIHSKGFKYIWSPGFPAKRSITKNKNLFDGVFYQTVYPWGYATCAKGKEYELTRAMANICNFNIYPNVESMNDTRWFTFIRDKIYTLWDVMLNYGVYGTTKLHFTGSTQIPDSCFSDNPFERQLYNLYHQFLRGQRISGMAKPLYNRETNYSLTLPQEITADKIRIMPRFTRNPPKRITRTMILKTFNVVHETPKK